MKLCSDISYHVDDQYLSDPSYLHLLGMTLSQALEIPLWPNTPIYYEHDFDVKPVSGSSVDFMIDQSAEWVDYACDVTLGEGRDLPVPLHTKASIAHTTTFEDGSILTFNGVSLRLHHLVCERVLNTWSIYYSYEEVRIGVQTSRRLSSRSIFLFCEYYPFLAFSNQ